MTRTRAHLILAVSLFILSNPPACQADPILKVNETSQEFPNLQVDAQKEFPNLLVDAQDEFPNVQVDAQQKFPNLLVDAQQEFSHE